MRFRNSLNFFLCSLFVSVLSPVYSTELKAVFNKDKFPFFFTAGYKLPIINSKIINSGHGLSLEFGINLGQYLSKKSVFGILGGFSFQDKLWSTSFNKNFVDDYLISFNKNDNLSQLDSSIIYASYNLFSDKSGTSITMPGCETKSFHNYNMYYGLLVHLPIKFLPYIKVYTGTNRSYFQGNGNITTKHQDFNIFELRRRMYGAEINFAKTLKSNFKKQSKIGLGVYFEYCNFYNSTLYFYDGEITRNIFLKSFASKNFIEKYKYEYVVGFKFTFIFI